MLTTWLPFYSVTVGELERYYPPHVCWGGLATCVWMRTFYCYSRINIDAYTHNIDNWCDIIMQASYNA